MDQIINKSTQVFFLCNRILYAISLQIIMTSADGLTKYISPQQLTEEYCGSLTYDHYAWFRMRTVCVHRVICFYAVAVNISKLVLLGVSEGLMKREIALIQAVVKSTWNTRSTLLRLFCSSVSIEIYAILPFRQLDIRICNFPRHTFLMIFDT